MGKMSFVGFNPAPGADPMGIGVPFYGESSFDPVEFIRRSWDENQAKQVFRDEQKAKGYSDFIKTLPTAKAWEESTAKALAAETAQISQDFTRDVSEGRFDPMGTSGQDLQYLSQYDKRVKDATNRADLYGAMGKKYESALDRASKVSDFELIDHDLTKRNLDAVLNESDVSKKNEMLNRPDLVVYKPKPVEVLDELAKAINVYVPDLDEDVTSKSFNPESGLWEVETLKKMDPVKLDKAMGQVWNSLSERVQNEFKRRYDNAPKSQKKGMVDGVEMPLDVQDWFKAQYSPQYAEKMGVTQRQGDTEKNKLKTGWINGARNEDGSLNLEEMADVMTVNTPVQTTSQTVKRTKRSGEKVYEDPEDRQEGIPAQYNTVSLPLTGFNKAFEMYIPATAIDTQTGKTPPLGKSASHVPVRIDFVPTWEGEPQEVVIQDEDENGNKTTQKYTINPGDRIPKEAEEYLQEKGISFKYEPYLMTSSIYGATMETKSLTGDLSWEAYVSRNGKTMIIPWSKARRELITKMRSEGYNTDELDQMIAEMDASLNSNDDIFRK